VVNGIGIAGRQSTVLCQDETPCTSWREFRTRAATDALVAVGTAENRGLRATRGAPASERLPVGGFDGIRDPRRRRCMVPARGISFGRLWAIRILRISGLTRE
jgi:hypothetical protein